MYGIELDRNSEASLVRQIYSKFSQQIINGVMKAGDKLPSTRELSNALSVSRSTVCEAYELLFAEGYLINRPGAAARVAQGIFLNNTNNERKDSEELIKHPYLVDFRTGRPDLKNFPGKLWLKLQKEANYDITPDLLGYTGPDGLIELRREIAEWLFRSRGMEVDFNNIFITSGATHGLKLISELLYKEGMEIAIEDPCHIGMLNALKGKGVGVKPIPVDAQGIVIEKLDLTNVFSLYLTPSHQFPLGGILPADRRAAVIRSAREHGIYIIEDDYDSEFRYSGEPAAPLFSMDQQQVIYVGTFSKILFPALRIGYVILPEKLHKSWRFLRTHSDVQNPPFEQLALASFLSSRKLDLHLKKMRSIYGRRRQLLIDVIREKFGEAVRFYGDSSGLHLVMEFPGFHFDEEFIKNLRHKGINAVSVEHHCIQKGRHINKLLLGYGHLEEQEITKGISLLYDFIKQYR